MQKFLIKLAIEMAVDVNDGMTIPLCNTYIQDNQNNAYTYACGSTHSANYHLIGNCVMKFLKSDICSNKYLLHSTGWMWVV